MAEAGKAAPSARLDFHAAGTRTFLHLLGNTLLTSVINFTVWFAITFYVYLETRSVFASAMIAGLFLVMTAFTGIWFGSLVDHHSKKTMMLLSGAASFVLYLVCFAIYQSVPAATFKDPTSVTLWVFVTLLMLGVIAGNIRTIALPTLVTFLIPEDRRDKANGLVGTASGVSFLVTSVISGVLVAAGGMFYVLLLAMAVLLLATVHLWLTSVPSGKVELAEGEVPEPKQVDLRGTIKVIRGVPGLIALILFTTINNFLGGVLMALMDPYGLSLVSVEVWGFLWGFLSAGFIIGGLVIARVGLGKNPVRTLLLVNVTLWTITGVFTIQASLALLVGGLFLYMCLIPFAEASEQTILQRVVPYHRQGRVFGFAQSVEQAASPLTAFLIGPIAQFIFIPFMTTGAGVDLIGGWFGTGQDRGIALVFTLTGIIGLILTLGAMGTKYYRGLSERYLHTPAPADAEAG
ncbi:MFS transporter [Kribbella sp. NBC_01245]|uniref:MFS transporter n=1 Tax=Kribbella sp. NBC_01245 TaxID=2903578 RepID=UPI002E2DA0A5|nr:MFS transporter [Kribbella sp. NBC_01245]